ncbi:MAG: energy transducer TonB [Crocinitomicaceae bacterium]|nr:energy transducer TonB [Crocinitomicaceae bacterium]
MKKRAIIIGVIAVAFGLTAYGFINDNRDDHSCEENPEHPHANFSENDYSDEIVANNKPDLFVTMANWSKYSITKTELQEVELISDIIPDYPVNWIFDYTSIEISSVCGGVCKVESNPTITLNSAQKELLNTVDISETIVITVKYKMKNDVTKVMEDQEMKVHFEVVPEVIAEYVGGYEQLFEDLKLDLEEEISSKELNLYWLMEVSFLVDAEGIIENVKLERSSGNKEADKLIVEWITKMPKWKPAEDVNGNTMPQKLQLMTGTDRC